MLQPSTKSDNDLTMVPLGQDYPDPYETIRSICEKYPGKYWRDLEDQHAYPEAFVKRGGRGGDFSRRLVPEASGARPSLPLRAGS